MNLELVAQPEWTRDALCAQTDPESFYPEQGEHNKATTAKGICQQCPARVECLAWALENKEPFGIWGGLTERERRSLRQRTTDACGTEAGYWRHWRAAEDACDGCRSAHLAHKRMSSKKAS